MGRRTYPRLVGPSGAADPLVGARRLLHRVDVVGLRSSAPVAQLDQSICLRSRGSGVRISPGAPLLIFRSLEDQIEGLPVDGPKTYAVGRAFSELAPDFFPSSHGLRASKRHVPGLTICPGGAFAPEPQPGSFATALPGALGCHANERTGWDTTLPETRIRTSAQTNWPFDSWNSANSLSWSASTDCFWI